MWRLRTGPLTAKRPSREEPRGMRVLACAVKPWSLLQALPPEVLSTFQLERQAGPSGQTPPPAPSTVETLLPLALLGHATSTQAWGSGPQIPIQSQLSSSETKAEGWGGGAGAEKRAGKPVDMFRRNPGRGAGSGRGPDLSHSCLVYQRGIVRTTTQEEPQPGAGPWGPGQQAAGFLTNCSLKVSANSTFLLGLAL